MDRKTYLSKIQSSFSSWHATEHSYRPELRDLFEKITWYKVINEPKWSQHGRPDFIFLDNMIPVCHSEAKDINISLEKIETSEQLSRYFGYSKLILTNGIEFRFYKNGQRYGEPIILAKMKWWILEIHEEIFDYFIRSLWDFFKDYTDTIRSAEHLAKIMGGRAKRIRDNLIEMLKTEKEETYSEIKKMKWVFKELLIHDLDEEKFADLYAQTLVYGLFVARYNDKSPESFTRQEARELVPKSNPLLRKFFDNIAGEAFEKRLAYIVDELCEVFHFADVNALMHGLYQKKEREIHDPVIHFYEDFLKEYDNKLRMDKGVFYTPLPVVKFMVRSIDEILKTRFWLVRGLLDTSKIEKEFDSQMETKTGKVKKSKKQVHRVQLLDPAVGTGTFLNEVIKFIYDKMQNQQGLWKEYVKNDIIPRLYGFELMMASYTIAHLKLWLTFWETWIDTIEWRLKIFLTNSLEEGIKIENNLFAHFGIMESLTDEARQAGHIKTEEPIMIILWNPPYSAESKNKWDWIMKIMEDYKKEPWWNGKLEEKNSKAINDDYVKFFRLSESLIEKNGEWILAFITNHGYIDNPTFRGMRLHLLQTFDEIFIIDLHGNSRKKETSPDGSIDQNVFDIQQGVSIFLWIKTVKKKKWDLAEVCHCDVYGKRNEKYDWLTENDFSQIAWQKVSLDKKYYFFCPRDIWGQEEYNKWFWVQEIFKINSMWIATWKDDELTSFSKENLVKKFWDDKITKFNYRPFDIRYIIFDNKILQRARFNFMINYYKKNNLWINCVRQSKWKWIEVLVSKIISNRDLVTNHTYSFPLYLYSEKWGFDDGEINGTEELKPLANCNDDDNYSGGKFTKIPNLDPEIVKKFETILEMRLNPSQSPQRGDFGIGKEDFGNSQNQLTNPYSPPSEGAGEVEESREIFSPEDILDYIYAVLHSKSYRETYKEFLKIDFPKVPYPKNKENFFALVRLWRELRSYHLMENPKIYDFITTYPIEWENLIEKVVFTQPKSPSIEGEANESEQGELWKVSINTTQYFWWIKKEVFDFMIWGYKPAYKYLNDRKGKNLSSDEFENYQKMIVSLTETIRIMQEIEQIFEV
jgi:predicted helicase